MHTFAALRTPSSRPLGARLAFALVVGAAALAASCDNPSCVFGPGNCQGATEGQGPGGGLGTEPASVPEDGAVIVTGPPLLDELAPSGTGNHPQTPIWLQFNESVSADSLLNALELVEPESGQAVPTIDPPPLVGGGRVALLLPLAPLPAGRTFEVRVAEGAQILDLTGQAFASSGTLGNFAIADEGDEPATPSVVASFPPDGETGQGDLTEIVVAFDREMDPGTVTGSSFDVRVNGAQPDFDAQPGPVVITGAVIPTRVEQVYTWRSLDDDELPASLGFGATVDIALSPDAAPIESQGEDDDALPATDLSFTLAPFRTPRAVFKDPMAEPIDAIGGPNLDDPDLPLVFVEFDEAYASGDALGVFLFADGPTSGDPRIALYRQLELPDPGDVSAVITAGQLDLVDANLAGRFADGAMNIAVRHERGTTRSALRLFDSDPDEPGPQELLFDLTPPTVTGLGLAGTSTELFVSDARDLVLVGLASEELARATVVATVGATEVDNLDAELKADVASSNVAGLFVARPVPLGVLEPADGVVTFAATLFDRALNSVAVDGPVTFGQRGGLSVGGVAPGGPIAVLVYDATTLLPLQGALVLTQQNDSGTYTPIETQISGVDGAVAILGATTGETVLTVDLEDYDLFTFSGVLGPFLQIPLTRSDLAAGSTSGTVTSPALTVDIGSDDKLTGDTRLPSPGDPLIAVGGCDTDPITFIRTCSYGPVDIEPGKLGGRTFMAANFDLTSGTFSAAGFLKAFAASLPAPPAEPDGSDVGFFVVQETLLASPPEEQPLEAVAATISLPTSDAWGAIEGDPEVTIEATGPGMERALAVGLGMAFEVTGQPYIVRGAYAGVADGIVDTADDELGELVRQGSIDADLLYRIELGDDLGNRVGIRPRFSSTLLDTPDLAPLEPPALRSPIPASTTGGASFDLVFDDVVLDAFGQDALYRVRLTSTSGRSWTLWRRDEAGDPGTLTLKVPNIGAQGGTPLPDGGLVAEVSAFALPSADLDTEALHWGDVERTYERFGHAAAVSFTQGP